MKRFGSFLLLLGIMVAPVFLTSCWDDPVSIESISITKKPKKLVYNEGEVFNPDGMEVKALFSDGSSKAVTDYQYSPKEKLDSSTKEILISYTYDNVKKTTSLSITVNVVQKVSLESIYFASLPAKTNYVEGDLFDPKGLSVFAEYDDDSEKEITDYTYSPNTELTLNDDKIIISYTEGSVTKTKEIEITVSKATAVLESIKVSANPSKIVYMEGEKFDSSDMVVTAVYSDGSEKNIKGYTYSPSGKLSAKDVKIEISYTFGDVTKTAEIEITVKKIEKVSVDYETPKANYEKIAIESDGDFNINFETGVITLSPSDEKVKYKISGYFKGHIVNNTKNTILSLNGAYLENDNGKPVILSSKKIEIYADKDTTNYIVVNGSTKDKVGAIQCYNFEEGKSKNIELGGGGTAYIIGNGFHGIKADEVKAKGSGTYYITGTSEGSAINANTFLIEAGKTVTLKLMNAKNGIKADENITIASGNLYFESVETGMKTDTSKDDKADNPKEHFITLSDCKLYIKDVANNYKTESEGYSETNVTWETF